MDSLLHLPLDNCQLLLSNYVTILCGFTLLENGYLAFDYSNKDILFEKKNRIVDVDIIKGVN